MEIFNNGSWQKLCTRSWGTDEEYLTCEAMGYSSIGVYNSTWYRDNSSGPNTSIIYNCTALTKCGNDTDNKRQLCKEVPVRLNGANIEYGGRVEVFYNGNWGKICRNEWNFEDVKVICRQLGFKRAVAEFVVPDVKDNDIPFAMSDVACNGDEPELSSCQRTNGKPNVDCQNDGTGAQALCEPKKDKIILNATQAFLDVGGYYIIPCSLQDETNHIRWFNNKRQEINSTSGTRIIAKSNGELMLENVQLSDGGTYECRGLEYTRYYTIYVNENPTAEVTPKPYPKLTVGDELRLTCKSNKATVAITWTKFYEAIPRAQIDTRIDDKVSKLFISEVVEGDSGEYFCEARNRPGIVARSTVKIIVKASIARQVLEWYYIVGPVLGSIVVFAVGWCICKYRRAAAAELADPERAVEMQLLNLEVDEWEIAVDHLQLQEVIGKGTFGAVWKALLNEPDGKPGNRAVAAKCFTPTSGEEGRKSLMREIELGKLLGEKPQPNIVEFIGCVTAKVHPIMVMEYLACGDLLGYLRKSRGIHDKYHLGQGSVPELEIYDLVLFAKQIAAGMVFLGSRGIIHRDLAARNVLLDDNFVCKVTDFGLAYQDFKYGPGNAKKGCIPIKWTAPEILLGNVAELSPQSDVWSYGIVLYEIFTIGGIPYPGWSEARVVQAVLDGYQMPKPDHIDDQLYDVMTRCCNLNPDFRPLFEKLRQRMDTYLREETYTELINMEKYDSVKYSKVEDLGAQDEQPSEQVKTSTAGKKLGKWSSVR